MTERDEQATAKFLRGLTLGALIGAIVAGSRIWQWLGRAGRRR
jgi:hypothetical protein